MPISGIIPQSKSGLDVFNELMQQNQENQYRQALSQQALGNAKYSKMLANLLNVGFGGEAGQSGQPGQSGLLDQSSMNQQPGQSGPIQQTPSSLGLSQSPEAQAARQRLEMLGIIKPTFAQQKELETAAAYKKGLGEVDQKTLQGWNETISSGHQMTPVLENLQEINADPVFQDMHKSPELLGYDLKAMKRFGNPDQIAKMTAYDTNLKSLYTNMGDSFKGAFREFEKKIFDQALPVDTDTLAAKISKTNTLLQLKRLVTQRLSLADNIVRSTSGQVSPANALEIADRQINGKQVRNQIQNEYKAMEAAQRREQELKNPAEPVKTNNVPAGAEVEIYDPQGKLVAYGTKANAAKFLLDSKHRGFYQKVISNG